MLMHEMRKIGHAPACVLKSAVNKMQESSCEVSIFQKILKTKMNLF